MHKLEDTRIALIGLGYVGLPLAVEFGKHYDTLGFDISQPRIEALRAGRDSTLEVDAAEMAAAGRLRFSASLDDLRACNVYIVTVPTPIDAAKRPDLSPLIRAEIWRCLARLKESGLSILVIDKNVETLIRAADRHFLIERGRVVWSGASPELAAAPDVQHRYLGV